MTMPEHPHRDEYILAEIRRLRSEVAAFTGTAQAGRLRHTWLRHVIKDLETNPRTQYKVHLIGCIYWLVNMPAFLVIALMFNAVWLKISVIMLLEYSLYANLSTDYGAMSAALAAQGVTPLPEIPAEPHVKPPGDST